MTGRRGFLIGATSVAVLSVGLGLLGITVYNCLFAYGLSLVEASRAALIVPANPAFTALFAALLLLGAWLAAAHLWGVPS